MVSNYRQAQEALSYHESVVARALREEASDVVLEFDRWHFEELAYLQKRQAAPDTGGTAREYVRILKKMKAVSYVLCRFFNNV